MWKQDEPAHEPHKVIGFVQMTERLVRREIRSAEVIARRLLSLIARVESGKGHESSIVW